MVVLSTYCYKKTTNVGPRVVRASATVVWVTVVWVTNKTEVG